MPGYARQRRGSYIAEAAVVLPFVILAIITTVLIILYFYDSSVSESRMHRAMRCEAGLITEKTTAYSEDGDALSSEDLWDGSITSSGPVTAKRIHGSKGISMVSGGLLARLGQRQLSGDLMAADPVRCLRLKQMVQKQDAASDAASEDAEAEAQEEGV